MNPLDLFDLRSALSEDEQLVQDSVARLVDERVLPIIQECFEHHRFPRELVPELAALGLLGAAQLRLGPVLAGDVPDLGLRERGAETAVPAAHGARRTDRLLRPDRGAR